MLANPPPTTVIVHSGSQRVISLADSGANVSSVERVKCFHLLKTPGKVRLPVTIEGIASSYLFYVIPSMNRSAILGRTFLSRTGSLKDYTLYIHSKTIHIE